MPGIGSTGLYIDANDNHYAAQIVGVSFKIAPVWRDKDGKITTDGAPGATSKIERIESGNFEVVGTFRDGTTKIFNEVPPAAIFEPDTTPAAPASSPAT